MTSGIRESIIAEPRYHGLRMTAEEYGSLADDGFRYELIDGVMCMSPSPNPLHQAVAARITALLDAFAEESGVGRALGEVDVYVGEGPNGQDIVYRPDVIFIRLGHDEAVPERITTPPALVVEVLSPTTRQFDLNTKREDYERAGVQEYWLIDPAYRTMVFYRLQDGRFFEVKPEGTRFVSHSVPGFVLDLGRVRKVWGDR